MTLFQVVKSLQTIALANPYIENAGDGSIYNFMNANPSIKYGVFFVSQTTHREDDYFDWYGFNLFVIDRLVDNLESNRLQIQSIAKEVLGNTIKTFIKKFIGITHGEIRYYPFTERFADLCAGQYCNVEFKIPKAVICEENFKEIEIVQSDCTGVYENGYRKGYEDGLNNCPECPDCPECSGYTQEDLDKAYDDGFESGHTSGMTEQKALLVSTAITSNGSYSTENGYGSVVVNVPQTGETINNQVKSSNLTVNGTYIVTYDSGYTGLERVDIAVNVPQTGYTQEDLDNAYQSGKTDQKALLVSTAITENGTYSTENGYGSVTINVPQTGYTQQDLDNAYNSGHTSGVTEGISQQKALLSSTTITENGTYTREDGYSAVTVNIAQTGHTDQEMQEQFNSGYTSGYTDGVNSVDCTPLYNSGRTDGIEYQKGLLSSVTFTENGTYTRADGWSAVTVNIDTQSYYDKGYEDAMKEKGDYSKLPLTFEIISGGNITYTVDADNQAKTIQYSKNYGEWTNITSSQNGTNIPVEAGDTLRFRGNVDTVSDNYGCGRLTGTKCNIYGNVMSLLNSTNFSGMTSTLGIGTFQHLFKQLGVVDASNLILPATTLTNSCYYHMFVSCTSLIAAPALPATNLAEYCYQGMFELCSNLPTAPELNATTLVEGCYMYMFKLCTSLNYIKCMATNIYQSIIPTDALFSWVGGLSEVNGTFVKSSSTNWVGERTDPGPGWGQDGVPLNTLQKWTIVNA